MVPFPALSHPNGKNSSSDPVSRPSPSLNQYPPVASDFVNSKSKHNYDYVPTSPDSKCFFSPLLSDEGEHDARDSIGWPSRREDCEWMAGKVTYLEPEEPKKPAATRGCRKRREADSTMFRNEIVGYGKQLPPSSSRHGGSGQSWRRQSRSKKSRNHTSSLPSTSTISDCTRRKDSAASSSATRTPLRDITGLLDNNGRTERSTSTIASLGSNRTTITEWERTLRDFLARSRDVSTNS